MTGIALGLGFLAGFAFGPIVIPGLCGLIAIRLLWPGGRALLVPALLLLLATGAGIGRGMTTSPPNTNWPPGITAIAGKVVSDPVGPTTSLRFSVDVSGVEKRNIWEAASGRVCVSAQTKQPVGYGDTVQIPGAPVAAASQPEEGQMYLALRGCGASLEAYKVRIDQPGHGIRRAIGDLRRQFDSNLMSVADGDSGALLAGLVTGSDWHLTKPRNRAFVRTSTSHITAVSGANLALLIAVLANLSGAFGIRRGLAKDVALGFAIVFYAALTGFGAPIIRAGAVALLALFAARVGRKPDLVTLLVLTAAVMVAINPFYLWSLSFRLSFVSSLALVLTAQRSRPQSAVGWLVTGLLATAAADLATLPLLPHPTLGLPVVAIPANLLIGPLIDLAYPLACIVALSGMVSPAVAGIIAVPASLLCHAVFGVVDHLRSIGEIMASSSGSTRIATMLAVALKFALVQLGADGQRFFSRLRAWPRHQWREAGLAAGIAVISGAFTVLLLS